MITKMKKLTFLVYHKEYEEYGTAREYPSFQPSDSYSEIASESEA